MNFIKNPFKNILEKNIDWKTKILLPYFRRFEKVLDFGCGDLSLSKSLKAFNQSLEITGVDVVNFKNSQENIKFVQYDGNKLPFKDNSFDTVISFYVFHHCDDVSESFRECARVAKKRILFVESVYRYPLEIPFMKIMDWIYNKVKSEAVSLPYQFLSFNEWVKVFEKSGMKIRRSEKIKQIFFPSFIPIGISYVFEVIKTK